MCLCGVSPAPKWYIFANACREQFSQLRDYRSAFSHIQFGDNKIKYFMKGSAGYTRIKITNCENNFLCSGKTNALKRTANIGLRSIFRLKTGAFMFLLLESRKGAEESASFMLHDTAKRLWNVI